MIIERTILNLILFLRPFFSIHLLANPYFRLAASQDSVLLFEQMLDLLHQNDPAKAVPEMIREHDYAVFHASIGHSLTIVS